MLRISIIISFILSANVIFSQNLPLLGPPGGNTKRLKISHQNPQILYANTSRTVYRTDDGGITTQILEDAHPIRLINTHNSNIVYSREWRSLDGGYSWNQLDARVDENGMNPINPNVIFGNKYPDEIWVTRDGGDNWSHLKTFNTGTSRPIICPSDTSILYCYADGIYKSINSGIDWFLVGDTIQPVWGTNVTINPLNAESIFLTTYPGLQKSTNGGKTWNTIFYLDYITDFEIDPLDSLIMYVIGGPHLLDTNSHLYKTTDGGNTWEDIQATGWPPDVDDRNLEIIVINPLNTRELYLGTYWGVYKSVNGGISWQQTNITYGTVTTIYFDPDSSGHIFVGEASQGILKTTDAGNTWERAGFDTTREGTNFSSIKFLPTDKNIGYAAGGNALYKTTDFGNNWHRTSLINFAEYSIYSVCIHPINPDTVIAGLFGVLGGGVCKSTDGGTSWTIDWLNNNVLGVTDIIFDHFNPRNVYLSTWLKGMFKSTNGGDSWQPLNNGLRQWSPIDYLPLDFVLRSDSTSILYVEQLTYQGINGGLFKTIDGGQNWFLIYENLNDNSKSGLKFAPNDATTLYTRFNDGLYKTTDEGKNWLKVYDGNIEYNYEFNPHNTSQVYYGTNFGLTYVNIDTTLAVLNDSYSELPTKLEIFQNYPNPFNSITTIEYVIQTNKNIHVSLIVYDILGKEIKTLVNKSQKRGIYIISFNAGSLSSGVYLYKISSKEYNQTKKMLLLR